MYKKKIIAAALALTTVLGGSVGIIPEAGNTVSVSAATTTATSKVAISKATVKLSKTKYVYTAKTKAAKYTPAVTVKYKGKTLKKGTDYTVTYKNNTKHGVATAVITGKGKYKGTKKVNYKIYLKTTTIETPNARITLPANGTKVTTTKVKGDEKARYNVTATNATIQIGGGTFKFTGALNGVLKEKASGAKVLYVGSAKAKNSVRTLNVTTYLVKNSKDLPHTGITGVSYDKNGKAISNDALTLNNWSKSVATYNKVKLTRNTYTCGSSKTSRIYVLLKVNAYNYIKITQA